MRSPLFIVCVILFAVHQVMQKGFQVYHSWSDSHLDNLVAMPIILSLWKAEQVWLWKKAASYVLSPLKIVAATVYIIVVSEIIFPLLSDDFTKDFMDVQYYALGSLIFYWDQNKRKAIER